MTVRAKFSCYSVTEQMGSRENKETKKYEPALMKTIVMSPVYANNDPNHENSKFWDASPGGKLELNVINPAAASMFIPGKEYYIDFTPAD